ncbi:hypothetical protein ACE193_18110 [Bernardetia sp. OM2101]|uniref:hypothetical protein n=1 Tax=Bernardetia sp. OM2101 TaxID=3344876 RepID=UPI0035CFCB2B
MRVLLQTIIFLLFSSSLSFGQNDSKNYSVGIKAGIDFIKNKDLAASPLVYSGFGLPVGFSFSRQSSKTFHYLESNLILPAITNNYPITSDVNTSLENWTKVDFNYHFLYHLNKYQTPKTKFYVGTSLQTTYFERNYDFLDGQNWEFLSSLNVKAMTQFNLFPNQELRLQIALPLLAFIHRKTEITLDENLLEDFYEGNFLLKYGKFKPVFSEWQSINWNISNRFKLNKKIILSVEANTNYYQISFPRQVKNRSTTILCGIEYQF